MQENFKKVGIIGLGNVGITAAYAMTLRHTADEIVLLSRSKEKGEGEKLDLEHGLPFLEKTIITATTAYKDLQDCDVIVITAGSAQKPGQSRLDLVDENKKIVGEIGANLAPYVKNSVIVVVSNPVDVLTYQLAKTLGLPAGKVLGTGTMLDTARFRFHLSEFLHVHPRSIHTYILGEHGESSFPMLDSSTVGGQPLQNFPTYTLNQAMEAFSQTKEAAAKIIQAKGATFYAIGVVISQLVNTILRDKRSVLPVSTPIHNYFGESDVSISVPCIVGKNGVEQILQVQLSNTEIQKFKESCAIIRQLTP